MEQVIEKPGFFSRIAGWMHRGEYEEEQGEEQMLRAPYATRATARYHITVRRSVVTFQDAVDAADGLKRGEQQVLNLTKAPADLRQKITDFLSGVNYAAEGSWEEVGEHVYLLAPASASVEVSSAERGNHYASRHN